MSTRKQLFKEARRLVDDVLRYNERTGKQIFIYVSPHVDKFSFTRYGDDKMWSDDEKKVVVEDVNLNIPLYGEDSFHKSIKTVRSWLS